MLLRYPTRAKLEILESLSRDLHTVTGFAMHVDREGGGAIGWDEGYNIFVGSIVEEEGTEPVVARMRAQLLRITLEMGAAVEEVRKHTWHPRRTTRF